MLLLTDVDGVYRNFGTPRQERIGRLNATLARALLGDRQAAPGSMPRRSRPPPGSPTPAARR